MFVDEFQTSDLPYVGRSNSQAAYKDRSAGWKIQSKNHPTHLKQKKNKTHLQATGCLRSHFNLKSLWSSTKFMFQTDL